MTPVNALTASDALRVVRDDLERARRAAIVSTAAAPLADAAPRAARPGSCEARASLSCE